MNKLPLNILYGYLSVSVFCFFMYAFDKFKAKTGRWRISEKTLHMLALLGGWPGAAFAQQLLRHKSKKYAFRQVYWVTVIVNISCLAVLYYYGYPQLVD